MACREHVFLLMSCQLMFRSVHDFNNICDADFAVLSRLHRTVRAHLAKCSRAQKHLCDSSYNKRETAPVLRQLCSIEREDRHRNHPAAREGLAARRRDERYGGEPPSKEAPLFISCSNSMPYSNPLRDVMYSIL